MQIQNISIFLYAKTDMAEQSSRMIKSRGKSQIRNDHQFYGLNYHNFV